MRNHVKNGWEQVGHIGVDAGLCWLGDPCYIMHEGGQPPGRNWDDFCRIYYEKEQDAGFVSFGTLGACVSTGHGDGCYPVEVYWNDGIVSQVRVIFQREED